MNPVDDALMGITHVLRGEDLLSSTPRQIALYHALIDIGVTRVHPALRPPALRHGRGQQEALEARPRVEPVPPPRPRLHPRGARQLPRAARLGLSADRDVFSLDELVAAFDVADVNPNPARFDLKKAESINGDHIRLLDVADFAARTIPYLQAAGAVVDAARRPAHEAVLAEAAPLVQERIGLLGEAPGMLGFLFTDAAGLEYDEAAVGALPADAPAVLAAAREALDRLPAESWTHGADRGGPARRARRRPRA